MKRSISVAYMMIIMMSVVLTLLSAALPAIAQQATPCDKDFAQYCNHITPGGGRLAQCYEQYKGSMSASCKSWAEGLKAHAADLKDVCSKEIDQRCNIEKGDPFGMLGCLEGNYVNLSPDCVAALNKFNWRYPHPAR